MNENPNLLIAVVKKKIIKHTQRIPGTMNNVRQTKLEPYYSSYICNPKSLKNYSSYILNFKCKILRFVIVVKITSYAA